LLWQFVKNEGRFFWKGSDGDGKKGSGVRNEEGGIRLLNAKWFTEYLL
jgi:hypothetical protein